ncbi:hypothetical protein [Metabacillus sp. 84]|uniref:hypothetical protein n=1 Tax=Metabacillus sp. 84 TaxID=3404705 RepID=UPI003CEB1972
MKRKLEYRLNDPSQGYPAIYHFDDLEPLQIFCRRNCDFFILEGTVYETTSSFLKDSRFVIYVKKSDDEKPFRQAEAERRLGVEVRLYKEYAESPEIMFLPCFDHVEVFSYLDNTYLVLEGKEYERVSAEMDQDRLMYVLYVRETGERV